MDTTYFDRQVGRDGEIDEAITTVMRARAELEDWERRLKQHKRTLGKSPSSSGAAPTCSSEKQLRLAFVEKAAALARASGALPAPASPERARDDDADTTSASASASALASSSRSASSARLRRLAAPTKRGVCIFVSRARVRRSDGAMEQPSLGTSVLVALPPRANTLREVIELIAAEMAAAARCPAPHIEELYGEEGARLERFCDIVDGQCVAYRCTGDIAPSRVRLTRQRIRSQKRATAALAAPQFSALDGSFYRLHGHEGAPLVVRIHAGVCTLDALLEKLEAAASAPLPGPIRCLYRTTADTSSPFHRVETIGDVYKSKYDAGGARFFFTCFGDMEPSLTSSRRRRGTDVYGRGRRSRPSPPPTTTTRRTRRRKRRSDIEDLTVLVTAAALRK